MNNRIPKIPKMKIEELLEKFKDEFRIGHWDPKEEVFTPKGAFNMYSIYTTLLNFLCINDDLDTFVLALCLIPLRQLTGYKWLRVIVSSLLSLLILMFLVFSAIMIFVIVYVIVH